jgi:ArsR family transcriptional regulator
VCALARQLGISEPAVSQHLKVLKTCGLVAGKKEGYFVHYQVNEEKIREIIERLSALLEMKNNQNAGQSLCSQEREA